MSVAGIKLMGRRKALMTFGIGAALGVAGLASAYRPLRKWWRLECQEQSLAGQAGYGPLVPDPRGLLDLPRGFSYRVLCRKGETMDDGFLVPGAADGAGVFATPDGYRIIRNHEISANRTEDAPFDEAGKPPDASTYDPAARGGTITLVLDKELNLRRKFLSLTGTERNCTGGVTPWGTWLSCEEAVGTPAHNPLFTKPHGYVFEVPAYQDGLVAPNPLKAMGRFLHEGAAVDPATGEVYLTEDIGDSCLYRFLPRSPGDLSDGKLFALRLVGQPGLNTANWEADGPPAFPVGRPMPVDWVELKQPDPKENTLRHTARELGAASFSRGEGIAWGPNGIVFTATNGGPTRLGQLWRYRPKSPKGGDLTLLEQPDDKCRFFMPDNVAVQGNGDVILAEDNHKYTRLIGITPDGRWYPFAYYQYDTREELAGIAYAPDGRFMIVNVYSRGLTLLITGPFRLV